MAENMRVRNILKLTTSLKLRTHYAIFSCACNAIFKYCRQKYFIVGHNKNIACKFMKQTVMDVVFLAAVLLLDEEDDIRE